MLGVIVIMLQVSYCMILLLLSVCTFYFDVVFNACLFYGFGLGVG